MNDAAPSREDDDAAPSRGGRQALQKRAALAAAESFRSGTSV
jgi:hypothetical protein